MPWARKNVSLRVECGNVDTPRPTRRAVRVKRYFDQENCFRFVQSELCPSRIAMVAIMCEFHAIIDDSCGLDYMCKVDSDLRGRSA